MNIKIVNNEGTSVLSLNEEELEVSSSESPKGDIK